MPVSRCVCQAVSRRRLRRLHVQRCSPHRSVFAVCLIDYRSGGSDSMHGGWVCMRGITDSVGIRSKDHNDVGRVTTNTPVWSVASTSILWATGGNPAPGQRVYRATVSWAIGVVPWTPYTVRTATFIRNRLCVTLRSTGAGRAPTQYLPLPNVPKEAEHHVESRDWLRPRSGSFRHPEHTPTIPQCPL